MNCQKAEALILRSLELELPSARRTQLEAHLSACAACRQAKEEHRCLTLLAKRWVPRAAPTELPADVFAAQVLARIALRRKTAPSSPWLPALAASAGVAALSLLPHTLWPELPNMREAVQALPGWLVSTTHALPADTLAVWAAGQRISLAAPWTESLLMAFGLLNILCYARTVHVRLKGSTS